VKKQLYLLASLVMVVSMACPAAMAEEKAAPKKGLKAAGIELDIKNREVRVDATVCLNDGILEYLVCLPGTFEHEAIFSVKCRPSVLHLSLLAIGLEPHQFAGIDDWWAASRKKNRAQVSIEVEYEVDGKKQRRRINEFLVNREREDGVVADAWVFTGSFFYRKDDKNHYAADATGAVIGLCREGASVLQYGEELGVPYQGEDQGLEVNAKTTPAVGTKVRLIFAPRKEKEKEKKAEEPRKNTLLPRKPKAGLLRSAFPLFDFHPQVPC